MTHGLETLAKLNDEAVAAHNSPSAAAPASSFEHAVAAYLNANQKLNEASKEFQSACATLRSQLGYGTCDKRFLVKIDGCYYLVNADRNADFDIEKLTLA